MLAVPVILQEQRDDRQSHRVWCFDSAVWTAGSKDQHHAERVFIKGQIKYTCHM